jgi:hypothetical protein
MTTSKKRKSGILKLALQSSFVFLILSSSASAELKDRFLFKISDSVVGVHDLEQAHKDLRALSCRFSDSLLISYLTPEYIPKLKSSLDQISKLTGTLGSENQLLIFLSSIRQNWKLLVYVDGQEVGVSEELEKLVKNFPGCPSVMFNKKIRDSFKRWLRVEIYLRSRFAPMGIQPGGEWRSKRLQPISQLVESLDKQLSHENFW